MQSDFVLLVHTKYKKGALRVAYFKLHVSFDTKNKWFQFTQDEYKNEKDKKCTCLPREPDDRHRLVSQKSQYYLMGIRANQRTHNRAYVQSSTVTGQRGVSLFKEKRYWIPLGLHSFIGVYPNLERNVRVDNDGKT